MKKYSRDLRKTFSDERGSGLGNEGWKRERGDNGGSVERGVITETVWKDGVGRRDNEDGVERGSIMKTVKRKGKIDRDNEKEKPD